MEGGSSRCIDNNSRAMRFSCSAKGKMTSTSPFVLCQKSRTHTLNTHSLTSQQLKFAVSITSTRQ